jgi:hypothetical protein
MSKGKSIRGETNAPMYDSHSCLNIMLTPLDFEYSSTRRVVSFGLRINAKSLKCLEKEMVAVDGIGGLSHPIQLRARRKPLDSFKPEEREVINRTRDSKKALKVEADEPELVLILEDDTTLGTQVEQWAVEYSSKFVHSAGPEFASTTAAVILGTAYVNKGLPEVSRTTPSINNKVFLTPPVRLSSSHAPCCLHSIHPPRWRKMHDSNQHLQILLIPHDPSNNRHNPLRASQNRRTRSIPNAAASCLPLSGVSEQRASVPCCIGALAAITDTMYWR